MSSLLRLLGPAVENSCAVLTYHRVSDQVRADPTMLNVQPRRFRQQVAGLLRMGYRPCRLQQLVQWQRQGEPFPQRTFAITFDDGFEDIYTDVRPVLEQLQVPATVFLATDYLDQDAAFPFADAAGSETSRPLTTSQCRHLQATGLFDLGSHTHTHRDFQAYPDEFHNDLLASLQILQDRFGVTSPSFSFPYGFHTPSMMAAARDCGVSCALTAEIELITAGCDRFQWGRFGATDFDTPRSLAAKVDGWYSRCRAAWRRLRRGQVAKRQQEVGFHPHAAASTQP